MSKRESGLESIKILASFIIVISHIAQTMINEPVYLQSMSDSLLITQEATQSITNLILVFFTYFGYFGVDIFVAASAWYLCENDNIRIKKVFKMIFDIFGVSVIILCIYLATGTVLPKTLVIKSLMPTFFFNNWFISCYLLFYVMHPIFNIVINNINQDQHRRLCIMLIFLYVICNFMFAGKFYSNEFVDFLVIYFCISYIKRFLGGLLLSRVKLLCVATSAIILLWGLIVTSNLVGLRYNAISTWIFKWRTMHNPLILIAAISLVLLGKSYEQFNAKINYISSLTLLIYIIHENILFRNYTRVEVVSNLLSYFGKNNALIICISLALILFLLSVVIAQIFVLITRKPFGYLANCLERIIRRKTKKV